MPFFHNRKQAHSAVLNGLKPCRAALLVRIAQSTVLMSCALSLTTSALLGNCPAGAATVEENGSGNATASQKGSAFFARAVQYYQRNDFKNAELFLRQAISEAPGEPNMHYYLANTLVRLNRHDEAKEEFKRAYNLDPYGPISGYCRKALAVYDNQNPDAAPAVSATDNLMRYSNREPSIVDPEKKVLSLRSQAEREKLRHQQVADSYSRAMNSTGDGEAQRIRQNSRDEIDSILHGTRYSYPWMQQAAEARAQQVQSNADELERIARDRAKERAAEYKAVSKEKGKSLDETVTNLERQFTTKALPGTPQLRHDGTDLFVRSYSPSTAKSPYPDAHPAVARVNPVHVEDSDDGSDTSGTTAAPLQHQVKGKVLN
jgi:hypothetical protein